MKCTNMCDIFRDEFKLKNFGLHHEKAESFVTAQWRWPQGAYLVYRVLAALYSVACFLAVTLMSIGSKMNIMVFLTIWTYLILCLYLIVAALTAYAHWCKCYGNAGRSADSISIENAHPDEKKQTPSFGIVSTVFESDCDVNKEKQIKSGVSVVINNNERLDNSVEQSIVENIDMNCMMKLSWMLADVVYVFGIVVTVVYFVALFPLIGVHKDFGNDLNMHAFNTALILADVAIVARPVRLLHVIYPVGYGLCYIIFSVIFWSQDKKTNVLYPGVLDWNYPGQTAIVISCLAIVGLPLLQLFHFGLFRLRLKLYSTLYGHQYM